MKSQKHKMDPRLATPRDVHMIPIQSYTIDSMLTQQKRKTEHDLQNMIRNMPEFMKNNPGILKRISDKHIPSDKRIWINDSSDPTHGHFGLGGNSIYANNKHDSFQKWPTDMFDEKNEFKISNTVSSLWGRMLGL